MQVFRRSPYFDIVLASCGQKYRGESDSKFNHSGSLSALKSVVCLFVLSLLLSCVPDPLQRCLCGYLRGACLYFGS